MVDDEEQKKRISIDEISSVHDEQFDEDDILEEF